MGKIISLKYDDSFKLLFQNEKVRRHFMSDVLGFPLEEIRSVALANSFLLKQYFKQKQGILDVVVELNNDSRIDIELQIKVLDHWDKLSLFYLSKMFMGNLRRGEDYEKLKRCVCISVLGFHLDERPEYHKVYRLRDETGHEYSDLLEIHIIELNKPLHGTGRIDDWIRLINAETEEELEMLEASTKNMGILEAITEVRIMSFGKKRRIMQEAHLKEVRDRNAQDSYVRKEGLQQGEDRLNSLNLSLIADQRYEDLEKAAKDKKYREKLYEDYHI